MAPRRHEFQRRDSADSAYALKTMARFRVNVSGM
jgi:Tfp pilus assembly pilus retraction ATPase PilT